MLVFFETYFFNKTAIKKTLNFVETGGTVVFATLDESRLLKYLGGIKSGVDIGYNTTALGYHFNNNFLPNLKGKKTNNKQVHGGFSRESFKDDISILATAYNDDYYPVIIENKVNNGNVILFNKYGELEKLDRGLLFAAILSGLENIAYPIANVATISLDDFPAPLYPILSEPIESELDITQKEYYKNVWWPDMLALADKYHIDYSAYVCFDYRNKTEPPFLFTEWELSYSEKKGIKKYSSDLLMKSLKESRHELGLHGYNHQSLLKSDWPNQKYMELGLHAARKRWIGSRYGKLPVSYVPPSNDIDSIGFKALENSFRSIKYNCSLYLGDFEDGSDREFAVEPYNAHFYNFPRISSGYLMDGDEQFNAQSLLLYTGIWTHFIHPDDVYQIKSKNGIAAAGDYAYRNKENYGWRLSKDGSIGLLPRFENYLKEIQDVFPMLDFVTVERGVKNTQDWQKQTYYRELGNDYYSVTNTKSLDRKQHWFNYIKRNHAAKTEFFLSKKNIPFSKTPFLKGFLFQIETSTGKLKLPSSSLQNSSIRPIDLYQEYTDFKTESSENGEVIYKSLTEKYIAEGKVLQAIEHLQKNFKIKRASTKELLELNTYLGWESKNKEIWETLNLQLANFGATQEVVAASITISEAEGFLDVQTTKKWLPLQLEKYPNDSLLQLAYLTNIGTYFQEKSIPVSRITSLLEGNASQQKAKNLLETLAYNYPKVFLKLVEAIPSCAKNYSFLGENITWFYANKNQFKKAIAWSDCSSVSQENIEYWRMQTGEYAFLKERNYPKYIEYLLYNKPKQALRELMNANACKQDLSSSLQQDIAYAYGSTGTFRKAILWANCVEDFNTIDKLIWYQKLENYDKMEIIVVSIPDDHPDKIKATALLVEDYLAKGDLLNAWKWVDQLPDSATKLKYQDILNKEVVYATTQNQKILLKNYASLFYLETAKSIKTEIIKNENSFIETSSALVTDKLDATSFGNKITYGFRDQNLNTHKIGLTQFNAYELGTSNAEDFNHYLYGAEYTFLKKEREYKINYNGNFGLQLDQEQQVFVHALVQANFAKDSLFSSAQLRLRPAITGPAYSLDVYQTQLNIYEELSLKKSFTVIANLETNYYSDAVLDATLTGKFSKSFLWLKDHSFTSYTEISGTLGDKDRESGYPYWSTKERIYGGLGLDYSLKNKATGIELNLDVSAFLDSYSESFQRFIGNLKLPVSSRFYINANAEFYTLENFNSNNFNLSLKYYLEKD
ncbi:DUF2194 domain-containing protein [Mesonia sp. MT50]|uniref:DUF2194 domain-containing protein n=1 Tax=Mesonia profundi TaxID=3070998 RepID=A0ABU1A5T0_9FLAO|nr:DUF2194 domain-containing protein [Mesonia profundi]MDQ7918418.1 DUF2194 domain-containing protein [Mesonia profundi]